jgi:hypothetical protein
MTETVTAAIPSTILVKDESSIGNSELPAGISVATTELAPIPTARAALPKQGTDVRAEELCIPGVPASSQGAQERQYQGQQGQQQKVQEYNAHVFALRWILHFRPSL